jgi:PAS domain S-box-containing protein
LNQRIPFLLYLLAALILIILLVISSAMYVNYTDSVATQKRQHQAIIRQTEHYLTEAIGLADDGQRIVEETYNPLMEEVLESMVSKYTLAGNDMAGIDLAASRQVIGFPSDIYLVNGAGIIEGATESASIGSLYSLHVPDTHGDLEEIRNAGVFHAGRAVFSSSSGEVTRTAYLPTPDRSYVIVIVLRDPALGRNFQRLNYREATRAIRTSHPMVQSIRIFGAARTLLEGDPDGIMTEAMSDALGQAIENRSAVEVVDNGHGMLVKYLYIPLSESDHRPDRDLVAEITYDPGRFQGHLSDLLSSNITTGILLFLVAVGVMVPLTYSLTLPVRRIAEDVNTIAQGDLDHPIRKTRGREFAVLGESLDQMVETLKEMILDLKKKEEQYRGVVESQSELISRRGPDGTITFVNEAFCRYFGVSREDIIGTRFSPAIIDDDLQNAEPLIQARPVAAIEYRVNLPEGRVRWLKGHEQAFFDSDGQLLETQAVIEDITEKKQAEKALRESEERFRELIEHAPVSIVLLRGAEIMYANPAARTLFRLDDTKSPAGDSLLSYIAPAERDKIAERNRNREQVVSVPEEYETTGLRTDGTEFFCHAVVSSIDLTDGTATIAFLRDITDEKRAAEELREINAEIEQRIQERTAELSLANRELEAFSYSVSHDLRGPLRAIDGFSGILMHEYGSDLPKDAFHYIRKIRENTTHMAALIDAVLELSHVGRQAIRREEVQPSIVVREVLDQLKGQVAGREIQILVGDLPPCRADPVMIRQVYFNLIENALKFTRSRDTAVIEIGATRDKGGVVYYVRDNGIGFGMQYTDKLFKLFQRLHEKQGYEGTGLGLAIVSRIIERHGGWIRAGSRPGGPTTFSFSFGNDQGEPPVH